MKRQARLPFAVLCSVPFVMVLSNSMLIPVLPLMEQAMDVSQVRIALVITAFSIPAGLVIPLGGLASDYVGRKAVLIPALILFGLGGLVAGLAPAFTSNPYGIVLAGRVLQGIGGGGTYQVAMALAGDIFQSSERTKAMGLLEASNGMGKVLSPIMGSAAALLTWYAPFFIYPALAWLSAVGIWTIVREPGRSSRRQRSFGQYVSDLRAIFADRGVSLLVAFALGAVVLFMLFGVLSWFSDVLEKQHGVGGFAKGLVIAVPVLVMAVTSWLSGTYLQDRLARWLKAVTVAGTALIAAALIGLFLVRGPVAITAVASVLGLGNGLVLPALNTLIASAAERSERGLVTSLYGTVRFFGAALGPPAFGMLLQGGLALMFLSQAAVVLAVGAAVVMWLDQKRLLPPSMRRGAHSRHRAEKVSPTTPKIRLGGAGGQ
ncbi:MAG TPA: MFS transporter [Bacillota bacterium]